MASMMQYVRRNEILVVAGYINGQVGKDRVEYEDYTDVMESEQ